MKMRNMWDVNLVSAIVLVCILAAITLAVLDWGPQGVSSRAFNCGFIGAGVLALGAVWIEWRDYRRRKRQQ